MRPDAKQSTSSEGARALPSPSALRRARSGGARRALGAVTALVLWASVPAAAQDAPAVTEVSGPAAAATPGWTGRLRALEEYRVRLSGEAEVAATATGAASVPSESDHDVRVAIDGGVQSPGGMVRAAGALALWADVDGDVPRRAVTGTASVFDNPDSAVWFDVFTLFAELRTHGLLDRVAAGRLASRHGPRVTFDGAEVNLELARNTLEVFAFGGRTHHFFEADADLLEDWIGSAGAVIRPADGLRLEVDYRFQQEDVTLIPGTGGDAEIPAGTGQPSPGQVTDRVTRDTVTDHTYGLAAWYRARPWLGLEGHVRGLDDQVYNAGLGVRAASDQAGLGAALKADVQPSTLNEINESNDPYTALLGASLPHARVRLQVWQDWDTSAGVFGLHLGLRERLLLEDEATRFNREHGATYAMVMATDLARVGLFASVVAEASYDHADSAFFADTLTTLGGALGWSSDTARVEAGTSFQRYRYDYFQDLDEVANVRVFYGDARYTVIEGLTARLRYQLDQFDRDQHTVWLTATQAY